MTTLLDTDDLDAAHHALSGVYSGLRMSVAGEANRVRFARESLGRADMEQLTFGMRFTGFGHPLGTFGFARLHRGAVVHRRHTGVTEHVAGDVFLIADPEAPIHLTIDDADMDGVFFAPDLLAAIGGLDRPPRFTGYQPISPRAAGIFDRAFSYVEDHVAGSPAGKHPLLAGTAMRMLAATALSVFPNDAVTEPTARDRRDAHPAALRRAVAFVDDFAHHDIGEAEVAAAAAVSVPALRTAFTRHLGHTPKSYLRRVRLQHAHHELRDADPSTTSIATVAARWGYADPIRFAADYRTAYDVGPADTLHRG